MSFGFFLGPSTRVLLSRASTTHRGDAGGTRASGESSKDIIGSGGPFKLAWDGSLSESVTLDIVFPRKMPNWVE